jgi:hypothetical protein
MAPSDPISHRKGHTGQCDARKASGSRTWNWTHWGMLLPWCGGSEGARRGRWGGQGSHPMLRSTQREFQRVTSPNLILNPSWSHGLYRPYIMSPWNAPHTENTLRKNSLNQAGAQKRFSEFNWCPPWGDMLAANDVEASDKTKLRVGDNWVW